ncbi:hypothetical protein QCA50_004462 [Cerrena zonata]|uniref:Mediator complex subunit 27 n=1 Tax=Cerrena zonata TaxID=2478898 RepID=A0AAW0GJJ0_9APHY
MDTTADKPIEQSVEAKLEARILLLSQLQDRIKQLRNVPGLLLSRQTNVLFPDTMFSDPRTDLQANIQVMKEVNEKIRSKDVQETLKDAAECEKKDPIGLQAHRSKQAKTSRPLEAPSPESPQAFPSFQPPSSQLLPSGESVNEPLRIDGLADYIRVYNESNKNKLHIWTPTDRQRRTALQSFPVTVRFTIPDVVTVFLSLGCASTSTTIIVESVTAFGPREKKPPHSQSDYAVYQKLSQQLAKVIQSQPLAPFQLILTVLSSYEDLFIKQCSVCGRVLSLEGHIPPVGRIWSHTSPAPEYPWEARHATCMHSV